MVAFLNRRSPAPCAEDTSQQDCRQGGGADRVSLLLREGHQDVSSARSQPAHDTAWSSQAMPTACGAFFARAGPNLIGGAMCARRPVSVEFQREKAKELIKFFNQQKAQQVYEQAACAPARSVAL